jgi:hypothetical protein
MPNQAFSVPAGSLAEDPAYLCIDDMLYLTCNRAQGPLLETLRERESWIFLIRLLLNKPIK